MQNPPLNAPEQPDVTPGQTAHLAFLKRLFARHPYSGALLLLVYWLVLLLGMSRILALIFTTTHVHLPFLQANLIGEILLALIVALPISLPGWWSETGFTRGINGQGLVVCLMPFVLLVGPVLCGLPAILAPASGSIIVLAVILALLVGFAEEGMFRGLILRALLPKGIWPAVLLSALFFACVHLTNLITGASWGYVVGQLFLAFGLGALNAAIRLRTGSIWPCIVLHAAHDVGGLILVGVNPKILSATQLTAAVLLVDGTLCLLLLLNAFVLLRPGQLHKLKVAYGLAPEPVAPALNGPFLPYYSDSLPYREFPADPGYGMQQRPPDGPYVPPGQE